MTVKSIDKEILLQIIQLLDEAHLPKDDLNIIPFSFGGNNQTFRVETKSGVFVAKKYFSHNNDQRDRLLSEFSFLSFAYNIAKKWVPKPIAQLKTNRMALYEFIEGVPFQPKEIGPKEVDAAAHFFCEINQPENRQKIRDIPIASEACFSIDGHLSLIQKRIYQIQKIHSQTAESNLAKEYANRLHKHLERFKSYTLKSNLDPEQRCISPSDFGFHNALRRQDNTICFIDFEYAGLDDPAKMVGDFFSQLAVPIPSQYFKSFTEKTMSCFSHSNDLVKRAIFLRPIYQVKWCCIALNIFLPYHLERRKFANKDLNIAKLQRDQLAKANNILESLESEYV